MIHARASLNDSTRSPISNKMSPLALKSFSVHLFAAQINSCASPRRTVLFFFPPGSLCYCVVLTAGSSRPVCTFVPACQIEISRRVTLEELPPVLVLHLKRFVFEKTGGCQKLTKNIDYPIDLEISKGKPTPHHPTRPDPTRSTVKHCSLCNTHNSSGVSFQYK